MEEKRREEEEEAVTLSRNQKAGLNLGRIVYSLAKKGRPFTDFEDRVMLAKLAGDILLLHSLFLSCSGRCQSVSVTWGWGLGGSSATGRGGPYQNLTAN